MRVTLTMHRIGCFLLILSFYAGCQSPEQKRNPTESRVSRDAPFDRHGRLIFTRHARCRMDCRHITTKEIQEILESGVINFTKSEPDARPDPKWALEGYTAEQQHLRIIVAPEQEKLIVITCMELGVEWTCHCN
jgi:hypothetical protein